MASKKRSQPTVATKKWYHECPSTACNGAEQEVGLVMVVQAKKTKRLRCSACGFVLPAGSVPTKK